MNKTIIISLALIAAVGVIATGATISYFSDTETSEGNTFTAGIIDISVNNQNPWSESFTLEDMKPCYTDYINFRIDNDGSDPNPVDIWKLLVVTEEITGAQSEPECSEEDGTWDNVTKTCSGMNLENNNLSAWIWYDLYAKVYNAQNEKVFWQAIYVDADHQSIDDIFGTGYDQEVYLGMIPAGGYMLVEQSYHLDPDVTNWAQGDKMTFNIQVRGVQLYGTTVLENKTDVPDYKIVHGDGIQGTLTYKVKHSTFDFDFSGTTPVKNADYTLLRAVDPWPQTGSIVLGTGHSDATTGDITITGDLNTGDMKDAKVWLILSSDWDGTKMTGWHQTSYLLEIGLFWYEDTDA